MIDYCYLNSAIPATILALHTANDTANLVYAGADYCLAVGEMENEQ